MRNLSLGNPIWSCQFQLLGGLRRVGTVAIVYTVLILAIYLMFYRAFSREMSLSQVSATAISIGAIVQCGLLILVGAGAIHKALLREYNTQMIEWYRTARLGAFPAVFGYLIGPALQVLLLWLIGVVIGVLICTVGQAGGVVEWLQGNICLLACALCIWSVQVFVGVGRRKPVNVAVLLVIASFALGGLIQQIPYLVGLYVLVGAAAGMQAYALLQAKSAAYALPAATAALVMAAFWISAAARRFRRPHLPALDPLAATGLLVAWCIISACIAVYLDRASPALDLDARRAGMLALTLGALLLSVLPVMMAAPIRRRILCGWLFRYRHESWPAAAFLIVSTLVAVIFVAALGGDLRLPAAIRPPRGGWAFPISLAILILPGIVFASAMLLWTTYRSSRTGFIMFIIALLWFALPLLDQIRVAIADANRTDANYSVLLTASPAGAVIGSIFLQDTPLLAGLIIQAALAVGALVLVHRARNRFILSRRLMLEAEHAEQTRRTEINNAPLP